MNFKKFSLWIAAAGLLVLSACNIFNPNGAEESSCESDNAECYIALGQSLINKENFPAAMEAYEKAIAIDSTKSNAYWGYATAAKFRYKLNILTLLQDLDSAKENENLMSFLRHSNADITLRLKVGTRVAHVMSLLAERDSLTQWYHYLTDSTKKGIDPNFAKRKAFITAYLASHSGDPSRGPSKFPLSDGKKKFGDALLQYMPYMLFSATLGSCDLAPVDEFDDGDRSFCTILFAGDSLGGAGDLAEKMKTDTVLQQNVNNKILDLQNGLTDLSTLLSQLGMESPGDTSGAPQQSKSNMDSIIISLGGTMVFYQFGDKTDNDGDGCVDEEFVDSVDNDLDGFVDEDARLLTGNGVNPLLPTYTGPADGVDNDHSGLMDGSDANENKFNVFPAEDVLTYVVISGKNENFVKIRKNAANMDVRIAIQNDSLTLPGRSALPGYQTKLQHAKEAVGGCWVNY